MPRDLEDVLHFFLPTVEVDSDTAQFAPSEPAAKRGDPRPAALPILTVPVAGRDVVRAAFAWNLTVELARLGARASLLAPRDPEVAPLWPESGVGPMGAQVSYVDADDAEALGRAAVDAAVDGAAEAVEGGVVVACVPPSWLLRGRPTRPLLRWLLLLATPEKRDLMEAYAIAKVACRRGSDPLVGVVVHGVQRMTEAERAYDRIAGAARRHLAHPTVSYGLLADELHVYRAIASRRPIGLEHPQSRAARALRDVARMLREDAQKMTLV